jgi:enterochelin esterase-like enzyme
MPASRRLGRSLAPGRRLLLGVAALAAVVTALGLAGAYRYVWTFWLYRGFPPPALPTAGAGNRRTAVLPGTLETIEVRSPAVGLTLPAIVYLPPGYFAHPDERYPSMYFLHGVPGSPQQFVDVGDVQVWEALLVARHQMPPTVLVMPEGAPSILDDTEWVNGVERHQDWMTYVATDVVNAVDRRFRVIDRRADRAIAGLSEGGYGALNIGLHHLGEFGVIESWSGYMQSSTAKRYYGGSASLVAENSPADEVVSERARLLEDKTYIWFYCGRSDEDLRQNMRFDIELSLLGVPHDFFVRPGAHNWKLWRSLMAQSLMAAGAHFAGVTR